MCAGHSSMYVHLNLNLMQSAWHEQPVQSLAYMLPVSAAALCIHTGLVPAPGLASLQLHTEQIPV